MTYSQVAQDDSQAPPWYHVDMLSLSVEFSVYCRLGLQQSLWHSYADFQWCKWPEYFDLLLDSTCVYVNALSHTMTTFSSAEGCCLHLCQVSPILHQSFLITHLQIFLSLVQVLRPSLRSSLIQNSCTKFLQNSKLQEFVWEHKWHGISSVMRCI